MSVVSISLVFVIRPSENEGSAVRSIRTMAGFASAASEMSEALGPSVPSKMMLRVIGSACRLSTMWFTVYTRGDGAHPRSKLARTQTCRVQTPCMREKWFVSRHEVLNTNRQILLMEIALIDNAQVLIQITFRYICHRFSPVFLLSFCPMTAMRWISVASRHVLGISYACSRHRVNRDGRVTNVRNRKSQDGFNIGAQLHIDCTKCRPHNTNSITIVDQCPPCRRPDTYWGCSQPEKASWRNTRRVNPQLYPSVPYC